jgi:hypothetical protein
LGIGGKLKKIDFDPKNAQKFVLEYVYGKVFINIKNQFVQKR